MWEIQLFKLNYDEREAEAAQSVIESGWLTMGERTTEFETNFSAYLGNNVQSVAVASGTAALHLALLALDIGPGDHVIIPALTFVADANVVRLVGATPVLADCSSIDDWNVSAASIEAAITPHTKAVIIVHYAGYPCDMPAIMDLCHKHGLRLIEDCAHAPGAKIGAQSCGTWGDVGCFSFFSNKNLSIGEGGMATSCNQMLHDRMRSLRSHGMTTLTLDRHKGRAISYDVIEPGLNYRMDEIRAAIGQVQLEKLTNGNAKRRQITERYRCNLQGSNISIPFAKMSENCESSYHILPILLPAGQDRNAVIESLRAKGIQASIHYPPFWSFVAYEGQFSQGVAPIAAEICERELTLPLYPTMTDKEVDMVSDALLEAVR